MLGLSLLVAQAEEDREEESENDDDDAEGGEGNSLCFVDVSSGELLFAGWLFGWIGTVDEFVVAELKGGELFHDRSEHFVLEVRGGDLVIREVSRKFVGNDASRGGHGVDIDEDLPAL